jgi:hypothetical protein
VIELNESEHPLDRKIRSQDPHQEWLERLHGGDGWQRRRDDEFLAAMESQLGPML